jgi:hypothetical protein
LTAPEGLGDDAVMQSIDHHRAVQQDGYTVVRGALSVEEVGRLRFAVNRYLEQPGAARYVLGGRVKNNPFALEPEELVDLVGHPRLADPLKAIGGPLKFAKEIGVAQNVKSGWHKDMRGLATEHDGDERQEPGLFKILLYLQDHVGLDRGDFALRVKRGSHRLDDIEGGTEEHLFTRAGDAIIIDCRITHRGQNESYENLAARAAVAGLRRLAGPRREYFVTQQVRRAFGRSDRQLVTILYGRRNHWTDDFIANSREIERSRAPDLTVDPPLPPRWQRALQSVEVGF